MDETFMRPISSTEPDTNFNQMNYLKQFLVTNKKKSDFTSFVKKLNKKK